MKISFEGTSRGENRSEHTSISVSERSAPPRPSAPSICQQLSLAQANPPSPLQSCARSWFFQVWMGPLGTALLPPARFLLHPLTQGPPATSELWSGTGWTAGLCPETAKVLWLVVALEQGCPERVKRGAPPSQYMSLLLGDLPGSLCWLCPNQTKRAAAFQTAASQKVGCCRAGLCWDPGWRRPLKDAAASWYRRLGGSRQSPLVPVRGYCACFLLCIKLVWMLGA